MYNATRERENKNFKINFVIKTDYIGDKGSQFTVSGSSSSNNTKICVR